MKALAAAGLGLILLTAPALAQGKKSQAGVADHSDAPVCKAAPAEGVTAVCRCEAGSGTGSVWGSGPYTADSSLCAAALHSGVIGAEGGAVELVGLPGQDSYEGSAANGVTTSSWGSYGQSFDVRPPPRVAAAAPAETDAPACDSVPGDKETLVCHCDSGPVTGSVWGSGPYTADSDICTAARHAGVIGEGGGVLQLRGWPGQDSYPGSSANGVSTSSWGSYGASFMVETASAAGDMPATAAAPPCDVIPGEVDRHSCACTGDIAGSVWGSGPYTADSNICSAARHAGVIGSDGGTVTVIRLQGLQSYAGSEANDEATASWGDYDASIVFDRN